ncbi:SIS domain-containing protein [Paenibacillus larvae]|uniref:SIS domain-containing protein n=1 Tax=Paenibacillus larvae TaxID=1464 RepID=UPI0023A926B5|nr:SIS domain-containing protein [Paenibacillus larvae]MDE5151916.1 SIS domain-containing protein [Paenibacillus larvae subsp. larvae]
MFINYSEEKSRETGAFNTLKEIAQQPRLWKEANASLAAEQDRIKAFFQMLFDKHEKINVIFTGAGTSAFVGETILPYLQQKGGKQRFNFQSIATTNLVSNPYYFFERETPTLLVSFARSGNSPESVASVKLGEQLVRNFYQINITCNPEGYLAAGSSDNERTLLLLMPEGSNDRGFAMTSSFTCMMLTALLLFREEGIRDYQTVITRLADRVETMFNTRAEKLETMAAESFQKIVYLGSGPFLVLSHEASLKFLELTAGKLSVYYESPLGFRHGPKSLIDDQTMIVLFLSKHPYTRKYDLDLLKELKADPARVNLAVISDVYEKEVDEIADYYFFGEKEDLGSADDTWLSFEYIAHAQLLAVYKSISLNIKPDNPSPSGSVNRVVKGVTIYDYE